MSAPQAQSGTTPPRIAIVGGGISGLAAAHALARLAPRAEIHLFEAAARLGGVIHTIEQAGFLIEQAADNFLVKPAAGVDLCRRVGLADSLLSTDESRRRAFIVRGGRLVAIPDGFYLMSPRKLWPLLTSPALSVRGKLRLLIEPFIPSRSMSLSAKLGDESIASFVRRRFGNEVFERLVQPLVAGIYTADPERLSMAATMPQFVEHERTHGSLLRATLRHSATPSDANDDRASGARYGLFVAPRDGMTSLIDALARSLPHVKFHLNAHVARVQFENEQWQVRLATDVSAANRQFEFRYSFPQFDALVIALPAHAAAIALNTFDPVLAAELGQIEYAGCAVVSLGYHRRQIGHSLGGFGFVVPQVERRRIIAGSFASLKYPGRAPDHHILIRAFIGGALQPEMLDLSDAALVRVAREELAALLSISGEPLVSDVARWARSMPQYEIGHLERVARIQLRAESHRHFALAGNAYRGVGIPQCIASANAAAERIANGLSQRFGLEAANAE